MNEIALTAGGQTSSLVFSVPQNQQTTVTYNGNTNEPFVGTYEFVGGRPDFTIPDSRVTASMIVMQVAITGLVNPGSYVLTQNAVDGGVSVLMSADPGLATMNYQVFPAIQ